MKETVKILREEGLSDKHNLMIGGGATSQEFATQIGAPGWSYDAVEATKVAQRFIK
jgi:methanogenic corrinoid protein MtbC1